MKFKDNSKGINFEEKNIAFTEKTKLEPGVVTRTGNVAKETKAEKAVFAWKKEEEDIHDVLQAFEKKANTDEEQAAASIPDQMAERRLDQIARKFSDNLQEDKKEIKELKQQVKEIKHDLKADIKEEKKLEAANKEQKEQLGEKEKSPFRDRQTNFSDSTYKFQNRQEKSFRAENIDYGGKNKFIEESLDTKQDKNKTNTDVERKKAGQRAESKKVREEKERGARQDKFENRKKELQEKKKEKKSAKKEKNKKVKKAASRTAAARLFESKSKIQNQLGDMSGEGTGNLLKDGSSGLLSVFSNMAKDIGQAILKKIMQMLGSFLGMFLAPLMLILILFMMISGAVSIISGASSDEGSNVEDVYIEEGDGKEFRSLTDDEIDAIIAALYETYNDPDNDIYEMGAEQEKVIRYALGKVGCKYSQDYHTSLSANIFDCSSLVYRAYRSIGVDVSNSGTYSAAEECRKMIDTNKTVSDHLIPGDLIFWGGADNGRYKGVYHVAIYVGNGKMVEGYGKSKGVIYSDVRNQDKIVCFGRPL